MSDFRKRRVFCLERLEGRRLLAATGSLTHVIDSPEFVTAELASGDLDGDGDLDVLLADGRAAWKENTGNGDFRFRSDIGNAGDLANVVVPFDVDDDGDLDVVSAYHFLVRDGDEVGWQCQIGWHENVDGRGGFAAKQAIATVESFVDLFEFVDVDADHDLDIVYSATNADAGPSWMENQNGEFRVVGPLSDHSAHLGYEFADMDGDERIDFVVREEVDGPFYWYRNTLDGLRLQEPLELGRYARGWSFFDIDQDGDADLVSPSGMHINEGDGRFTQQEFRFTGEALMFSKLGGVFDVVDADSDGDFDVIYDVGNDFTLNYIAGILWNRGGEFVNTPLTRDHAFSLTYGDFNGDATVDLLYQSHRSTDGNLQLFDAFDEKRNVTDRSGPANYVNARDMDFDGDLDLLVSSFDWTGVNSDNRSAADRLVWYENLGDMRFGPRHLIDEYPSDIESGPSMRGDAGDLNGDGKIDVVSAIGRDLSIRLDYLGDTEQGAVPDFGQRYRIDVWLQDVDIDRDLDILISPNTRDEIITLINDGSGRFTVETHPLDMTRGCSVGRWQDIDHDGDYDFAGLQTADIDGQRVHGFMWRENKAGTFEPCEVIDDYSAEDWSFDFADLDNDGDLDRIEYRGSINSHRDIPRFGELRVHETRLIGDVNDDRVFDSTDLIAAFAAGEYEDRIVGNSTFEEGDWNGDGEFDSADFVTAFQAGTYVREVAAARYLAPTQESRINGSDVRLLSADDVAAAASNEQDGASERKNARHRRAYVV